MVFELPRGGRVAMLVARDDVLKARVFGQDDALIESWQVSAD